MRKNRRDGLPPPKLLVSAKPRATELTRKRHLQLLSFERNEVRVAVNESVDIMTARKTGWEFAMRLEFSASETTLIAAITSELACNIIYGSNQGAIIFSVLENGARRGIEVVARHEGAGLSNIERSAHKRLRTPHGRDLVRVGKLVDEFAVISELRYVTTVTVEK